MVGQTVIRKELCMTDWLAWATFSPVTERVSSDLFSKEYFGSVSLRSFPGGAMLRKSFAVHFAGSLSGFRVCATKRSLIRRKKLVGPSIKVLAADDMEGRDTGSPGLKRAEAYAVEQLKAAGLQPAGVHGFYQPVKVRIATTVGNRIQRRLWFAMAWRNR